MAMYWSAVMTLVATIEDASEATSEPSDFAFSMIGVISRSSTPAFSTTPPNASAVTMSQIVFSMLSMPPRVASMSIGAKPVVDVYPLASASQTPLSSASHEGRSPASAYRITRSGATITASTPPATAPRKIAVNGGTLNRASTTTTASGRNSTGEM